MVHPCVRWWRRSKSPSTESTPARSAERMPWSDLASASGRASDASESSLEVPGCMQQQPPPQWDQPCVVFVKWTKRRSSIHCDPSTSTNMLSEIKKTEFRWLWIDLRKVFVFGLVGGREVWFQDEERSKSQLRVSLKVLLFYFKSSNENSIMKWKS